MGDNRRIRHLRRGSALVYSSMLMVAITTVVVTTSQLNAAASGKAERQIDAVMTEESENGAVAYVSAVCNEQTISLPATYNLSLNGQTQTVSVLDANATMSRTIRVNTVVNGRSTRSFERLIAGRQAISPTYYGLFLGRPSDLSSSVITTTNSGHIFCRGNLTLNGASNIDGEVAATGSVVTNGATVSKNTLSGARDRLPATFNSADYETAAAGLVNLLTSLNSITFLTLGLGLPYNLKYYRGDMQLKGTIKGRGTAFFEGNLTVENDVKYDKATDQAVFIVTGNMNILKSCKKLDGIWIVAGHVTTESDSSDLEVTRGALVFMNRLELNRPLIINADKTFWTDRNEAVRHRAPGFWPTAITGLLR